MMDPAELAPPHLRKFLEEHAIDADFVAPGVSMPTVPLAAQAIGVSEDHILKTLVFVGDMGKFVVVIASGTRRVDLDRLAEVGADAEAATGTPQ